MALTAEPVCEFVCARVTSAGENVASRWVGFSWLVSDSGDESGVSPLTYCEGERERASGNEDRIRNEKSESEYLFLKNSITNTS